MRFILITVLIFINVLAQAQTSGFVYLGVENGLVQSQIQTIEQDNSGNLWIGTMAGLSKYNGFNFKSYFFLDCY